MKTHHGVQRRRLSIELALVPLAFAAHNAEEALTIGTHLPRLRDALGAWARAQVSLPTEQQYLIGLAVVTLLSFALLAVAWRWDLASVGLVVLQVAMALNVLSHVAVAIALCSYVPGLWTALLIQAPMVAIVLSRVNDAGWLSRAHWWRVGLAALMLHGPALWLLLAWLQTAQGGRSGGHAVPGRHLLEATAQSTRWRRTSGASSKAATNEWTRIKGGCPHRMLIER